METGMKQGNVSIDLLRKLIPFLGLAVMIFVFQVFGEGKLLTVGNMKSILNQSVYVAIMAFGAVFVYAHAGMDLSYGGVIGFSVLTAILAGRAGAPLPVILLVNVLSAVMWFAVNGFISVYLRVSPFITSLCIMYMCRGILNTVCAKEKYSVPVYIYDYDNWTVKITVLIVVYLICWFLFEKSSIGKQIRRLAEIRWQHSRQESMWNGPEWLLISSAELPLASEDLF